MGRKPPTPEGYVTRHEAAELLGVSIWTINLYLRRGLLVPHLLRDTRHYFIPRTDVLQLKEMKTRKGASFMEVRLLAMQAKAAVNVLERRMADVYEAIGLEAPPLPRDPENMSALIDEMRVPLSPEQVGNPIWIRTRAMQFFGIDQLYLELASDILETDEPWKFYVDHGISIKREAWKYVNDRPVVGEMLYRAYKTLDNSLSTLNNIAFLYCRSHFSRRTADKIFGKRKRAKSEIEELLDR